MQEPHDTRESMDVVAFHSRIWLFFGFVVAVLNIVVAILVYRDGSQHFLSPLMNALSGVLILSYCTWMGYCAWRNPVLHLGSDEIRWCPPGTLHPKKMPVDQVTGFSWPARHDLWIEGSGGAALHITMIGIRRRDRERVRSWLSARWTDHGLAAQAR